MKSFNRLPKRKVTIDELLSTDDIADILQDLYEKRHEIDQFILIYTNKEGIPHDYWQGTKERIIYCLERAKNSILNGEEE